MSNGKYSKRRGVSTKAMSLILAVVLIVGVSVGATLAWLTATSGTVTNTFTVGDINISIAESDTDKDGSTTKNAYKIVPGGEVEKDPKITVAATSEKCYVYAYVVNNVKIGDTVVATPNIDTADWTAIGTNSNGTLYRYKEIVDATSKAKELTVFSKVSYAGSITKDDINTLKDTTITVQGFAHQSDNTTQEVADKAALTQFSATAIPTT